MWGWIGGGMLALAIWETWEWWRKNHGASGEAASGGPYEDAFEAFVDGPRLGVESRGAGKTVFAPEKFQPGLATVKGLEAPREGERVQVLATLEDGGGYWAVFEGPFVPEGAHGEAHVDVDRVVQDRPDLFFAAGIRGKLGRLGKPIGENWSSLQRPEWGVGDPNVTIGDMVYGPAETLPSVGDEVLVVLEEKNPLGAARMLARGKVLSWGEDKSGVSLARVATSKAVASLGPLWGRLFLPRVVWVSPGLFAAEKVAS